jgi:hypothetical protein
MRDQRQTRFMGWALAVAGVLAMFVLLALMPPMRSADDRLRKEAVFVLAGGHGHVVKYALIMPMLAVVPYRIGRAFGIGDWTVDQFVLLVWVPWSLLIGSHLARLRDVKFGVGVVTLTTISMFSLFVTGFNAEALALMLVSYGALLALDGRRVAVRALGAVLMALGAASIPVQVLALGVVGLFMLRRRNAWFLLAAAAGVVITVADATWTEGHFALSKYPREVGEFKDLLPWGDVANFGYPLVFGLVGVLFSFGRGLLWFQPALFVRSVHTTTDVVRTWRRALTLFVVVMIPVYSKWWAWYGGFTFGPRFFLLGVVPAAVVITERLQSGGAWTRWAVGVVLGVWNAWVAIAGSVFYMTPMANKLCRVEQFRYEPACWYFGEYSPLLAPLWEHWDITTSEIVFMVVAPVAVVALVVWVSPRSRWRELTDSTVRTARTWRP